MSGLFVVSAVVAIVGQVSITAWCKQRWPTGTCLVVGLAIMASAFALPIVTDVVFEPGAPTTGASRRAVRS